MKQFTTAIIFIFIGLSTAFSQSINWNSKAMNQSNAIYLNVGYDYGVTTQLGFGKNIQTFRPVFLSTDISIPMGKNLVDDFKYRLGGQIDILEYKNWHFGGRYYFIAKRYQTSLVRQISLGSEAGLTLGYYRPSWHIATEFGIDRSVASHLKHTEAMQDNYAGIQDAWFKNTAGQMYVGIQASRTIGSNMECNLRVGKTKSQKDHSAPILPVYCQLGLVYHFN